MIVYAIKHVRSGKFLLTRAKKRARGFTHDEPEHPSGPRLPRLFHSERAARCALSAWLKGEWSVRFTASPSYFGDWNEDEDWQIKPVASRSKQEMEIVKMKLTEN